jgi:hypothetical protein
VEQQGAGTAAAAAGAVAAVGRRMPVAATAIEVWAPEEDGGHLTTAGWCPSRGCRDGLGTPSLLLRLLLGGVLLLRRATAAPVATAAPASTAAPAAALATEVGSGADAVPSARLGCRLGGGGECSNWRWRAASQGEFLQGQVVLHLQEGGEGADAS